MKYLVTGVAGFIGFHVAKVLLERGDTVVGLDNLNDYYDVQLKRDRLTQITDIQGAQFNFIEADLADRSAIEQLFRDGQFDKVINLAAQAGVRYSIQNPHAYIDSNIVGFMNILEGCRHHNIKHLVYASSSSVYGANEAMPFSEHDNVDHPLSIYAATKKSNELMAHTYSHLYDLPSTGLRFFTVYGPWGRPDMALFMFTKAILAGEPIPVFNDGKLARDFTFIDDIVEGLVRVLATPATKNEAWAYSQADPASSGVAPHRLFNIGCGNPVKLMDFIAMLEDALGKKAIIDFQPMQPGDVEQTWCDVTELEKAVGYRPAVDLKEGVAAFVDWYRDFYKT